jgi:hypothetical protein
MRTSRGRLRRMRMASEVMGGHAVRLYAPWPRRGHPAQTAGPGIFGACGLTALIALIQCPCPEV